MLRESTTIASWGPSTPGGICQAEKFREKVSKKGEQNMRNRLTGRLSLLILSFAIAMIVFPAMAFAETIAPDGTTSASLPPTIQSDKEDYAPGELVTLTGSKWQANESVNIVVNDSVGNPWSRDVTVTADASGAITDQFNLPNSFIAE